MRQTIYLVGIFAALLPIFSVNTVLAKTTPQVRQIAQIDNNGAQHPQNNGKSKEYVLAGDRKREANDNQGALADYNQAIALNPKNDWAYYKRALLKKDRLNNDDSGAVADYSQAISLNPEFADAYTQRGILKKGNLRDYQGGKADLDRAIALDPKSTAAYIERASLKHYDLKDDSGALADLNRSIEIEPKHYAYYLRASVKENFKDYQGAVADYTQAIALSGNMTDFSYHGRGKLKHYQLNDYQGALADYNQAIALNPQWEAPQKDRQILLGNSSSNRSTTSTNSSDTAYSADNVNRKKQLRHTITRSDSTTV